MTKVIKHVLFIYYSYIFDMLSYIIMNIIIFIFSYYNSQEKLIIAFDFYHIAVNHDFQSTVNNLIQYIAIALSQTK